MTGRRCRAGSPRTSPPRTAASTCLGDPSVGETYTDILARHRLNEITADGERNPQAAGTSMAPAGAFAARFAEVRIEPELGLLRVTRIVSAIDAGRILNEKLARSQIIGGTVMGIGMTMLEETVFDPGTGRIANATFGDYLIPVNADVPDLDVVFIGNPDQSAPSGSRASARSASSACRPPSPTPSTTPPAGASDRCRSPSSSCCSRRMPELIALTVHLHAAWPEAGDE